MKRIISLFLLAVAALTTPSLSAQQAYTPDIIELDGTNGLTVIPHPNFALADGGTIEFWVVPDWTTDPGYDPVIVSNAGASGVNYMIALLRDRDGLGIVAGDREEIVDFDFTDGQLHHVAISDYGEALYVYIDGVIVGEFEQFSFASFNSAGVWIGSADGETAPFIGAIASMRFWGLPIEREELVAYSRANFLTAQKSDHPAIDALRAVSDFTNRDVLIVESELEE